MKFEETELPGLFLVELEPIGDERGHFARAFCRDEFRDRGLNPAIAQINTALTRSAGTFRGFHYQVEPATECKLIRCVRGSIFDVVIDLRQDSPTYLKHYAVELNERNRNALYMPDLFAHGYLTLEDDTEVSYSVSEFYAPDAERGIGFNDPIVKVEWPREIVSVSDKDASWPPFLQTEIA